MSYLPAIFTTKYLRFLALLVGILLLMGCFSTRKLTQQKRDFAQKRDSLVQMVEYWDSLSPFEDEYAEIDSMLNIFPPMLERVLLHPEASVYAWEKIPFFNTMSEDGRIGVFSWDEKTGGTYQPQSSFLVYKYPGDSIQLTFLNSEIYVNEIIPLTDVHDSTLYVLYGYGRACMTCIFAEFHLYKLTRQGLENSFEHSCAYRSREGSGYEFDPKKKELDIFYYDFDCTESGYTDLDSCKVDLHYYFDGETFIEKE